MATDPIGTFSGLASGIQWRDMIDQIMQLDQQRQVAPLTSRQTAQQNELTAWTAYQTVVAKLRDAAAKLADPAALGALTASAAASPTSGRALLGASASSTATPGSYAVEVMSLASAEKLSGDIVASATTDLGISGSFSINGRTVTIASGDSLAAVRDRINAANTATGDLKPSGVGATILTSTDGSARLVLTSERTGGDGIQLVDQDGAAGGVLQQLGLYDGTTSLHVGADGRATSSGFSSTTAAIASLLGVTMPPPSTIKVNGQVIQVDLTTDSISSIVARINAAGGSASTITETVGGSAVSRIAIDGTVAVDGATPDELAASQRTLEALGFLRGGTGAVAQSVRSKTSFTTAGGGAASSGTLLTDLRNGDGSAISVGDTVTIAGLRADGSSVNASYSVTGTSTVADLLGAINGASAFGGAGAGRTATASIDASGRIVLTDDTGGDSRLALSLGTDGTFAFGGTETSVTGRARQVVAGTDAQLRVDGVYLTRSSNSISDAIAGLTLNLQSAEAGQPVTVTVSRDVDSAVKTVKAFASAYNDVLNFVESQKANGALSHNGTLRTTMASLTQVMLSSVTGVAGTFTRAAVAGVSLSKTGSLEVDTATLTAALQNNAADVVKLFATSASATGAGIEALGGTSQTQPGTYSLNVTALATKASVTGAGFATAGGVYSSAAVADTLKVSDAVTGRSASIALQDGDTMDDIVVRLNAAFAAQRISVTASNAAGELRLDGSAYGSSAKVTVEYLLGGAAASGSTLGVATGSYAGTDVQGEFVTGDGTTLAATGSGQILTASEGVAQGLAVRYTGTSVGAGVGTSTYVLGVSGMMQRAADAVARSGDGIAAMQSDSLNTSLSAISNRIDDVQARLDRKRESLVKQFTAMEAALSRIQSQSAWLSSQILALQSTNGNS